MRKLLTGWEAQSAHSCRLFNDSAYSSSRGLVNTTPSGPSLPAADYTYQKTLTVGASGSRYGFKLGSYGQLGDGSIGDRTWESELIVEFWVEKPSTYRASISFSANPFLTYTSPNNLFFRVNSTDFFEISSGGASYFQNFTSDATLAAIWDELNANQGGTVDLVIQARTA